VIFLGVNTVIRRLARAVCAPVIVPGVCVRSTRSAHHRGHLGRSGQSRVSLFSLSRRNFRIFSQFLCHFRVIRLRPDRAPVAMDESADEVIFVVRPIHRKRVVHVVSVPPLPKHSPRAVY